MTTTVVEYLHGISPGDSFVVVRLHPEGGYAVLGGELGNLQHPTIEDQPDAARFATLDAALNAGIEAAAEFDIPLVEHPEIQAAQHLRASERSVSRAYDLADLLESHIGHWIGDHTHSHDDRVSAILQTTTDPAELLTMCHLAYSTYTTDLAQLLAEARELVGRGVRVDDLARLDGWWWCQHASSSCGSRPLIDAILAARLDGEMVRTIAVLADDDADHWTLETLVAAGAKL